MTEFGLSDVVRTVSESLHALPVVAVRGALPTCTSRARLGIQYLDIRDRQKEGRDDHTDNETSSGDGENPDAVGRGADPHHSQEDRPD